MAGRSHRPQKNLERHVSFNESTLKPSEVGSDIESQKSEVKGHRKRKACCNMCCAWASIIAGTFILIILILGVIFFSFFQANMPEFHVQSINVHRLEINSTSADTFLDADVEVILNSTNKNSKLELYYSPMKAETSSDDVSLGNMHLPELAQKPGNTTQLKVRTVITRAPVAESDGKKLQMDAQNHQLLLNVDLKGIIHYNINGNKMTGFPFKVFCDNIYQGQLDGGQTPKCLVKLTPVS